MNTITFTILIAGHFSVIDTIVFYSGILQQITIVFYSGILQPITIVFYINADCGLQQTLCSSLLLCPPDAHLGVL
jgi:hypothetical protein